MSNSTEESILALATEAANDRAGLRAENAHLRAQRDALLAACEVAYKFARGKHSTITYWPKNICNQLAAAIEAAREKP